MLANVPYRNYFMHREVEVSLDHSFIYGVKLKKRPTAWVMVLLLKYSLCFNLSMQNVTVGLL